ncbi:MAG TPA: aminotransferase class I/II-fold pyridoxal phosphate-dependent enzyme, partial [Candidatus Baltobacteraceae bacterium]
SLPPAIAGAARAALALIEEDDSLRDLLTRNVQYLRGQLVLLGVEQGHATPIIPLIFGEAHIALTVAEALRERGIFAPAIRPPTVPVGHSLLRIVVRADHSGADLHALARALRPFGEPCR